MQENEERWKELYALAAIEQDPKRLLELTKEINRLLELKEHRLKQQRESAEGHSAISSFDQQRRAPGRSRSPTSPLKAPLGCSYAAREGLFWW